MSTWPVIQEGRQTDVPALIHIMQANVYAPHWTPSQAAALFERSISTVRRVVLVSRENYIAIGFAVISLPVVSGPMEAELENIAVVPERKRQGIGHALLEAAHAWALQNEAACLRLEVRQSNTAALGLYTKCGWARVGLRRRYYAHPAEDAIVMQRKLGQ